MRLPFFPNKRRRPGKAAVYPIVLLKQLDPYNEHHADEQLQNIVTEILKRWPDYPPVVAVIESNSTLAETARKVVRALGLKKPPVGWPAYEAYTLDQFKEQTLRTCKFEQPLVLVTTTRMLDHIRSNTRPQHPLGAIPTFLLVVEDKATYLEQVD